MCKGKQAPKDHYLHSKWQLIVYVCKGKKVCMIDKNRILVQTIHNLRVGIRKSVV